MTSSWACYLQRFSSPWLDTLAYHITNLGSPTFFIIVLPSLYWLWNKRSGYRVAFAYLVSVYFNTALKTAFHTPRPGPTDCSRVMHPETGPGYSFPSGHAQGSTVFWGQLSIQVRRGVVLIVSALLIVLISLSRVYLNVHWPIDILGGILVGFVILRVYNVLLMGWENLHPPVWLRAALSIVIPATLAALHHDSDSRMVLSFLSGVSIGTLIQERYFTWREHAPLVKQVLKFILGMAGLLCVRYGLKALFPEGAFWDVLRYAVGGIWVSLGAPYLFVRFGWQE